MDSQTKSDDQDIFLRYMHNAYSTHAVNMRHDDVIKWKHFPRYWPFVRGIHRSSVNSAHKGQWRGALMFSMICARINGWVNNRKAGDLRRHRAHYDVIVMVLNLWIQWIFVIPTLSLFYSETPNNSKISKYGVFLNTSGNLFVTNALNILTYSTTSYILYFTVCYICHVGNSFHKTRKFTVRESQEHTIYFPYNTYVNLKAIFTKRDRVAISWLI